MQIQLNGIGPTGVCSAWFSTPRVGGGSKSQKPRLRLNAAPGYFVFLGVQFNRCIYCGYAHPALPRSRVMCWRLWRRFLPFFAPEPGVFIFLARYYTHVYFTLFRVDYALCHISRIARRVLSKLSLSGDRSVSVLSPSPYTYWSRYLFPRKTLGTCAPRVSARLW